MSKKKKVKQDRQPLSPEAKRNLLISGLVLFLLILLKVFLPPWMEQREKEEVLASKQVLTNYTKKIASQLPTLLKHSRNELKTMSTESAVIKLFNDYKPADAARLGRELQNRFENTLKLRLLPPDIDLIDTNLDTERPPLTFASLGMTGKAVSSEELIPAEWIMLEHELKHIVLVQRVNDSQKNAIGVLHLSLNVEPILTTFKKATSSNFAYTELRQHIQGGGSVVLIKSGNAQLALSSNQAVTLPVSGARWFVKSKAYPEEVIEKTSLIRIGAILLVALLIGLLLWLKKQKEHRQAKLILTTNKPISPRGQIIPVSDTAELEKIVDVQSEKLQQTFDEAEFEDEIEIDDDEEIDVPDIDNIDSDFNEAAEAPASIFRAYDIRGIVDETLTEKVVYNIGRALGSEAIARGDNLVAVGRDGRLSSPALSEALIKGLTDSGRDVIDIGMVPTPVLYYAANYFDTSSGIMITGSHNPPNYNGIKMVLAGTTLADEAIQALRQRIINSDYSEGQGKAQSAEIGAEYTRRITDDIPVSLSNSFKVVVDAGNGVAGQLGPQLVRALGHDVVELFCEIDGNFPNHHPDPSQPENLEDLIRAVKEQNADMGFAFDGDGDRLGVVDRDGNVIWPDRQMMLFAKDVIERNPGCEILFDVKCSNHLKRVIEEAGGKATMWKTGHSLIKGKMKESGALLAGEMSGHVFFKERWYGFDDGLYTAARLLEILSKADQPPHEIFASLPGGVATPELKLNMHEDNHRPFMASLFENADFGEGEIGTIDGIRVDFTDGWGLIRPSNTTPCLVLRFEADNETALERIKTLFKEQLLGLDASLKLPF